MKNTQDKNNDIEVIDSILQRGADIDGLYARASGRKETMLINAIVEDKPHVVRFLLEQNADPDKPDEASIYPIHYAARNGSVEIVQMLLDAGAQPDAQTSNGETALKTAALYGYQDVVTALLDADACIDKTDNAGYTALNAVASVGDTDMAMLLLEHNADPNIESRDGHFPLRKAVLNNQLLFAQTLIKYGADVHKKNRMGGNLLKDAVNRQHSNMAQLLLALNVDPNQPDNDGYTPLETVVKAKRLDIVKLLLDSGADVYRCFKEVGCMAIFYKQVDILKELLPHYQKNEEEWPKARARLLRSAIKNDVPEAAALLNNNGDVNDIRIKRFPLVEGILRSKRPEDGSEKIISDIKTVLSWGVDINALNAFGSPALYYALHGSDMTVARFLVENGADVNMRVNGKAFIFEFMGKNSPANEVLKISRVSPDMCNEHGTTPLMMAVYKENKELVQAFLEQGHPVDAVNQDGECALSVAIQRENKALVQQLLDANANPNTQYRGCSLLEKTISRGQDKIAAMLVNAGADINTPCLDNVPAIRLVVAKNCIQTVDAMFEHGLVLDDVEKGNVIKKIKTPKMAECLSKYMELGDCVGNRKPARASVGMERGARES